MQRATYKNRMNSFIHYVIEIYSHTYVLEFSMNIRSSQKTISLLTKTLELYIDENKFDVFLPKRFNEKISNEYIRYWNEKGNLGIKFLGRKYNDLEFGDMNHWFHHHELTYFYINLQSS